MVPKVNKFDFYSYETVGGKIIQLVGESTDRFKPAFLTEEQILKIRNRAKLCEILSSIEFRIDSYGLINFFVEHDDEIENFKLLKELLIEFNDSNSIEFIEKSLLFLLENKDLINELKSNPDDSELRYKELESRISFRNTLYESTVLIDNEIRNKPNDFCFDEFGSAIDPNFSGKLQRFYPSGRLKHEYKIANGRVHGEGIDYDFEGRKEKEILFNNGKKIRVLRSWDKNGIEK